jgi:hypothetical protein
MDQKHVSKTFTQMSDRDGAMYAGEFRMGDSPSLRGELRTRRGQTTLDVFSSEYLDASSESIAGILHDRTKVSLIDCVRLQLNTRTQDGAVQYSAAIYPHLALFGDEHLTSADARIVDMHFLVEDAATLFNDFTSFGVVLNARDHIESLVKANERVLDLQEPTQIGDNAEIFYYSGKSEIFRVETSIGTISASHNPSFALPGARGFSAHNRIFLTISTHEPVSIAESLKRLISVLRFMEVVVGRPQNILTLSFRLNSTAERPVLLDAYWCMPPSRTVTREGRNPHPIDNLIDAARQPEYFSDVLQRWIARQTDWQEARMRFSSSFESQNFYSIDRLVAAANMFDLLPETALQPVATLCPEIAEARAKARALFLSLAASPERDSILGALGRLGRQVLKRKVRDRASVLREISSQYFPDLELVLDSAVESRNHFVHGSDSKLLYEQNHEFMGFFTEALEFVFAASDLIECGWDIKKWVSQGSTASHPFANFRVNYLLNLTALKQALGH